MIEPLMTLTGRVVHGRGNGRRVGMPTANLRLDPGQLLPPAGVYISLARVGGQARPGVTNIGPRPSVDDDPAATVETFLPGYAGDLYGQAMELDVYKWLRDVRKMDGLDAVKRQVDQDAQAALHYFTHMEGEKP